MRRIAGMIDVVIRGLQKLNISVRLASARQIEFNYNGNLYRAGYEHPHKNPRSRGALAIWRIQGNTKILVRRFETLEDAAVFCRNPSLDEIR